MSDESLEIHASVIGSSESNTFEIDTFDEGELKLRWHNDMDCVFPELVFNGPELTIGFTIPEGMSPEELGEWITEKAQEMPKENRCKNYKNDE